MGKTSLQDVVIEEARELVQDITNTHASPINPVEYLTPSIANVICALTYGERFSHQDEKFRRLAMLVCENAAIQSRNGLVEFFPFLRFVPFSPFRARHLAWSKNVHDLTDFFGQMMRQHQETLHETEPRDYLHAYLLEAERQKSNPKSTFTSEIHILTGST